jgi:hypothetical protein
VTGEPPFIKPTSQADQRFFQKVQLLYLSPIKSSTQVFVSFGAVLLAPLVLCLGWFTGVSMFAVSCETFRRGRRVAPLQ